MGCSPKSLSICITRKVTILNRLGKGSKSNFAVERLGKFYFTWAMEVNITGDKSPCCHAHPWQEMPPSKVTYSMTPCVWPSGKWKRAGQWLLGAGGLGKWGDAGPRERSSSYKMNKSCPAWWLYLTTLISFLNVGERIDLKMFSPHGKIIMWRDGSVNYVYVSVYVLSIC